MPVIDETVVITRSVDEVGPDQGRPGEPRHARQPARAARRL